jgi:hypothetical protein
VFSEPSQQHGHLSSSNQYVPLPSTPSTFASHANKGYESFIRDLPLSGEQPNIDQRPTVKGRVSQMFFKLDNQHHRLILHRPDLSGIPYAGTASPIPIFVVSLIRYHHPFHVIDVALNSSTGLPPYQINELISNCASFDGNLHVRPKCAIALRLKGSRAWLKI